MPMKSKPPHNKVNKVTFVKPAKPPQIQSTTNTQVEPQRTASGLDHEAEDQFELELCWCIQQLQAGLMDIKLQDKQVYNMTKSLNVLKSNNASLIKKRQVMRNTFGDYRSKMAEDEKKFGRTISVVKFTSHNKKLEKKSTFLKKAHRLDEVQSDKESKIVDKQSSKKAIINLNMSNDQQFTFNFLFDQQ